MAFETLYAPDDMPGQKDRFIGGGLKYPYVEGLRLDEAMHPLTLMTVGVYGKALPRKTARPFDSSFHGSMVLKVLNLSSALN